MEAPRPTDQPSKLRTIARRAAGIAGMVTFWAMTITVVGLFFNMVENDTERPPDAKPSPSATPSGTPITWPTITVQCADGWPSHSIGQRGACSHHGGVIMLYHSSLGDLATLCPPGNRAKTLERAQELMTAAGVVDCDYGQPPEPTSTPTGEWGPLKPK